MSNFLKSNNPILSNGKLTQNTNSFVIDHQDTMTIDGAVNKTLILFGIMLMTTVVSYMMPSTLLLYVGLFGGLGAVLFASFKPHTSATVAPIYAALEGLFVGTISAMYASMFQGIVFQAVSLTFGTLVMMLLLYKSGLIKVTEKLKMGIIMATGAIMIVYLVSIVGSFVGFNVPFLHDSGPMGIGISLLIIGVAAFNLLIDFDAFEKGAEAKAPKYMEWFVGMGLLVTLVWLYIEFLRLLSKLRD